MILEEFVGKEANKQTNKHTLILYILVKYFIH